MPVFRYIQLALIDSPDNPMRSDSFTEGMAELISSIAEEGLHQPIGVREQPNGRFTIIFGHRRSFACQELKWETVPAFVYAENEGDNDTAMGTENFQRTQVNQAEEAAFYHRMQTERDMSIAEICRRWKRPPQRVAALLSIYEGHPDVLAALAAGQISIAQATELNKFTDDFGREQHLHYAAHDGLSAQMIRLSREQREATGQDVEIQRLKEEGQAEGAINYRSQVQCHLCQEWPKLEDAVHRMLCNDCSNLVLQLYEGYRQHLAALEQGQGAGHEEGH